MRLLQVIHSLNPAGGGPIEHIKQLSQALAELGHAIEVVCLDSPDAPWLSQMPIKVFALGPGLLRYGYSNRFVPWLQEHAKGYGAVIVRGMWQYSGFGVWRALHKTAIPYFVFPHGMLDPWFGRRYPLKHIKKWLYWPWAEYRVLRDAKAVMFTCEQEMILARKSFWLYKRKEKVVNYGIALPPEDKDAKKEIFLNKFPKLRGKRLILFLGRIHPKKGCDILMRAFSEVCHKDSSLHLVIAGPDQIGWQKKLQILSKKLGLDERMTFTGLLKDDLKWGAFYASEAFILPSHQENFGISVVEALGCGLPVLISDKVNIWREIISDKAGLAGKDDVESTKNMFKQWFELSNEEKEDMKKNTKRCFYNRFEIHKAAESLLKTIERCLA